MKKRVRKCRRPAKSSPPVAVGTRVARAPARIRTCGVTPSGSSRESSPSVIGAWAAHAVPVPVMTALVSRLSSTVPGRRLSSPSPRDRPPSLHHLRHRHGRRCLALHRQERIASEKLGDLVSPAIAAGGPAMRLIAIKTIIEMPNLHSTLSVQRGCGVGRTSRVQMADGLSPSWLHAAFSESGAFPPPRRTSIST